MLWRTLVIASSLRRGLVALLTTSIKKDFMTDTTWSVKDKIVLVTGATNGIGKVTALRLAEQGAHVVIVSRSAQKCAAVSDEIRTQSGNRNVEWIAADLATLAGMEEAATEFRARHQQLHVLINNAGGVFAERIETVDGYEMTFALNHLSYFRLTQLLRDLLIASAPARIINVSSDAHYGGAMNFDDLMGSKSTAAGAPTASPSWRMCSLPMRWRGNLKALASQPMRCIRALSPPVLDATTVG